MLQLEPNQHPHYQGLRLSTRAAAHSLKSSSAYLGAVEFSGLCKRIETAARENDLTREIEAIERLPDCFKETIEALQPYLQKAA